ncbi:MAG: tRNA (guanosine(46)-N7)-methyltransferase TrmB [Brevinematia bacterium]
MEKNTFPFIKNEISPKNIDSLRDFLLDIEKKKVVLDIGCGHGDFLIRCTLNDKETLFVGIEISRKRAFKTSERLNKRGIENYRVINGDGEFILKTCFPDSSIDEINVLFPDPWLKKHQWKNRIFKPSFIIQLIRVLKNNGEIFFATDVREYAEEVYSLLREFKELKNKYSNPFEVDIYPDFPTLFFKKMSPLRPINYICFKKIK